MSINGKKIDQDYALRVDNITLNTDFESFIANVKACEIDHIQICSYTSVAKAVGGTKGVIDIYYRDDIKINGKVALAGSTYGNGMVYADIANKSEKLTVRGYTMARTSYGKAYPTDVYKMTDRGGDHCSPISDTTIMSSAGAQCEHLNHVTTQLPYALTAATVSFLTFLVAGFTKSALISLTFGIVALFLFLMFFRHRHRTLQSQR